MKRRRFVTRMIPTTLWAGAVLHRPSFSGEATNIEQANYQYLKISEAETLAAWCKTIVSGADVAGVARFVDQNLAGHQAESLLLLRYLDASDMAGFYRKGIAGIDAESHHRFDLPFVKLSLDQQKDMIAAGVASEMEIWTDPDPNFFYFISRSDAVDVVYGTKAGFAEIGIPYLAHIPPPQPW